MVQPPRPPAGPWQPAPPRSNRTAVVVSLAVALVVVVAAVVVVLTLGRNEGPGVTAGTATSAEAPAAPATVSPAAPTTTLAGPSGPLPVGPPTPPDGLGDDGELDDLAQSCFDADWNDCISLYQLGPEDSAYELYGRTCAGRIAEADAEALTCFSLD